MTRSADTPPEGALPADALPADALPSGAIPGETIVAAGDIMLNEGCPTVEIEVANSGDRPIQVGSHYHFAETNPSLRFDRAQARGMRLDVPSGGALRFEPGQSRRVTLIPLRGARIVQGFRGDVMGALD